MGSKTKIEWCDNTWNPITGCLHGCEYCYARKIAERFGGTHKGNTFRMPGFRDLPKGCFTLGQPCRYEGDVRGRFSVNNIDPYPFGFQPTLHEYRLDDPVRWTKPLTIFVCSMADLFGDWVPDEWIAEVFQACIAAPQHRYLFLTKNTARYRELYEKKALPYFDNFWFGTTITKPGEEYTWFQDTPYHSFISIEPMLECFGELQAEHYPEWVIIGAETGNRKGKIVPVKAWIDDVSTDCCDNGIPMYMKDSLIPIVGEQNMIRKFPWNAREK